MSAIAWWKSRKVHRCDRSRLRDAHRFGQDMAREWLAGSESVLRVITPGAGDSLAGAAFRHGLVAGTSVDDATQLAQAVLSGMAATARNRSRLSRPRNRPVDASYRDAAQRGVAWMVEQVLRGSGADFELGRTTIEKVRGWSPDSHFGHSQLSPSSLAGR